MRKHSSIYWLAGLVLSATGSISTAQDTEKLQADIRWTAHGIPHIQAADEKNLGFGIGYAYARDNACLLLDEILTVRGERARFFGADGKNSAKIDNVTSDFFYRWLNDAQAVKKFLDAQPKNIKDILSGYTLGFNQYLATSSITNECVGEPWVRPIATEDLIKLARKLLVSGGAGQFTEAIVNAAPPSSFWFWFSQKAIDRQNIDQQWLAVTTEKFKPSHGSNAIAVGKSRAANSSGMLLGNPHFPWVGGSRFYQIHLTIPDQLDVMGASLAGFPFINIGFNKGLAWTHTVDASNHFTLYKLTLDKDDPTRYLVDGKSLPLEKKSLTIQVRDKNGASTPLTRDIYESIYGPVVIWPGQLEWTKKEAYVIRDANVNNNRLFQQWHAINQAQSVAALRESLENLQGAPWVNTLAVDQQGKAIYLNHSVIPYLKQDQLTKCTIQQLSLPTLPVLTGDNSQCQWATDESSKQTGIAPASSLPVLEREDFVQNSNDSAWFTNPAAPLKNYSPLVSREGSPLGLRARFGLSRLQGEHKLTEEFLEQLVFDNHVYIAELIKDDLLTLCKQFQKDDDNESLARACLVLAAWDGKANPHSNLGIMYLYFFADYFHDLKNQWKVPFDPKNPATTPRGINLGNEEVVEGIKDALIEVDEEIQALELSANATWGSVQVAVKGKDHIAIPGAHGTLGVYNAIESDEHEKILEVVGGSSYIQLVSFTQEGLSARGLLTYSQSSDKKSRYYRDQTELFSQGKLYVLPFTDEQINADPALVKLQVIQQ